MNKTFKSFLSILPCFTLLCSCSNAKKNDGDNKGEEKPTPTEKTPIDLYLIAGQSNAAGYSAVLNNETETFDNVQYAGMTDVTLIGDQYKVGSDFLSSPDKHAPSVTSGLGYAPNYIGPEYGMAKAINDRYKDDKEAMIIKTAAGGTTLSDVSSNLSGVYGNWYPKSLWPQGYEPNITSASKTNKATGILYKLFIENFKMTYNYLVSNNYEPTIVGMAWAQGESDADLGANGINTYAEYLKVFIEDIRDDIASITGDDWYRDYMPFAIAKIATSYVSYNRDVNLRLINQQIRVSQQLENVETVETSDLIIIKQNGQRNDGVMDDWHFNFSDMTTLGSRFVETIDKMEL